MHENDELVALRTRFERLRNQRARGVITQDEFSVNVEDMIAEYCEPDA